MSCFFHINVFAPMLYVDTSKIEVNDTFTLEEYEKHNNKYPRLTLEMFSYISEMSKETGIDIFIICN
ncbi:MAG TPA: hypothetical protein PKI46_08470, partial [Bacteroidales bacterium]|nr:hypothetical protein [Bacteroidales bacterium]